MRNDPETNTEHAYSENRLMLDYRNRKAIQWRMNFWYTLTTALVRDRFALA